MRRKERRRRSSFCGSNERGRREDGRDRQRDDDGFSSDEGGNHHPDIVNRQFAELYNVDSVQIAATARVELFLPSLHQQHEDQGKDVSDTMLLPTISYHQKAMRSFQQQQQLMQREKEEEHRQLLLRTRQQAYQRQREESERRNGHCSTSDGEGGLNGDGTAHFEHNCEVNGMGPPYHGKTTLLRRRQQSKVRSTSRLAQHQNHSPGGHGYGVDTTVSPHRNSNNRVGGTPAAKSVSSTPSALKAKGARDDALTSRLKGSGGIMRGGKPLGGRVILSSSSRERLRTSTMAATAASSSKMVTHGEDAQQRVSGCFHQPSSRGMMATIGAMPSRPHRRSKQRFGDSIGAEKLVIPLKQLMSGANCCGSAGIGAAHSLEVELPLSPSASGIAGSMQRASSPSIMNILHSANSPLASPPVISVAVPLSSPPPSPPPRLAPLYKYSDCDYDTDSDKVLMRIQRISSNSMQQSHIAAMEDAARYQHPPQVSPDCDDEECDGTTMDEVARPSAAASAHRAGDRMSYGHHRSEGGDDAEAGCWSGRGRASAHARDGAEANVGVARADSLDGDPGSSGTVTTLPQGAARAAIGARRDAAAADSQPQREKHQQALSVSGNSSGVVLRSRQSMSAGPVGTSQGQTGHAKPVAVDVGSTNSSGSCGSSSPASHQLTFDGTPPYAKAAPVSAATVVRSDHQGGGLPSPPLATTGAYNPIMPPIPGRLLLAGSQGGGVVKIQSAKQKPAAAVASAASSSGAAVRSLLVIDNRS